MDPEIIDRIKSVKSRIEKLIEDGNIVEATDALEKLEAKMPGDADVCSMQAVIAIIEGNSDKAKQYIKEGLKKDSVHFDLLFNLAYINEQQGKYQEAADLYSKAATAAYTDIQGQNIDIAIKRIQALDAGVDLSEKARIVFFVKEGMDSFLGDIINGLSEEYWTRKTIVSDLKQIDDGMKWADICWFEWCDELIAYGSKLEQAPYKKIICRLHRYEAFTNYIYNVAWGNVNKIVFVSENIKNTVLNKVNINEGKCAVILNGIDIDKFRFLKRSKGFNLAWVGYLNLRKNPMLVLQYLHELVKRDKRYKLHIAGSFQDEALQQYMDDMIHILGLSNNVIQYGFVPNDKMNEWLKDKNYLVTGSIAEGHPVGVMEAMSCGLKPVIHYFPGAEEFYPKGFIYYDLNDFIKTVTEEEYDSYKYHNYIKENFSIDKQLARVRTIIEDQLSYRKVMAKVSSILGGSDKPEELGHKDITVLIPCYNRAKMLLEDLDRGFKLGNQNKLIVDDCSTEEKGWLLQIKENGSIYNCDLIQKSNNEGLAQARWTGFQNVKTKYSAILDDDDMLLCINGEQAIEDINQLRNDYFMVIPRYSINLTDDKMSIGYDRSCYDGWYAHDVLKDISLKSEIKVMLAGGSIGPTDEYRKYSSIKHFRVAEDFVLLSRLLAANGVKKIKVSDSLVHIRRMTSQSLIRNLNDTKLMLGLFAQAVACYYCLENGLANPDEVLKWMKDRADLIQQLYNFGESFEDELIDYLTGKISEEVFVHFLVVNGLKLDEGLEELAPELTKMREIFYKKPEQKSLLIDLKDLPLVSIIIPTFNRRDMLNRAINQALKQDYPNIEIIVTDNCSEDGTEEMIKSNYKDEKRIIYNRNIRNIGPALNIHNAFYNIARGKYCVITSDDDYIINSEFIKKAVILMEKQKNMAFVFAGVYFNHKVKGKVFRVKPDYPNFLEGRDFFVNYTTDKYKYMPNQNALVFSRDKAIEMDVVRENANMLAGDLFFQLRMLLTGNAGFINDIVLIYTLHNNSLSINAGKCTELGEDNASKAVVTAMTDIRELGETLKLARQYKFLAPGEDYKWFNYRVWKYMYWRIIESTQTISECKALINFLEREHPDIYDSLKNVAAKRFGEKVLK